MQPHILYNTLEFTDHFYTYHPTESSTFDVVTAGVWIRKLRVKETISLKSELQSKFY